MSLFDTDRRIFALAFARMADSIGNSFLIIVLPLYISSGVISGQTFGLSVALVTGIILSALGFLSPILQPIRLSLGSNGQAAAFHHRRTGDSHVRELRLLAGRQLRCHDRHSWVTGYRRGDHDSRVLAGLGALLVYSQVQETLSTGSKPASGAQPAGQD